MQENEMPGTRPRLADLVGSDASIRPMVMEILRESVRSGSPAMKARCRKLLKRMESEEGNTKLEK